MRDSQTWWDSIKKDENLLVDWLLDQYHGEATAAVRIRDFIKKFPSESNHTLEAIAKQEEFHAQWILKLLEARGVAGHLLEKTERYWAETLPEVTSFETGTAVAAKAEEMRLERIRTICRDHESPADVREVFLRILPQELVHEAMFRLLTTSEALNKVSPAHVRGLEALGLVM